ncbi:MAG TPA: hypothetical protein VGM05_24990 [Planctomycetaceae bacterium]|jgi:hypothetical protein
MGHFIHGFVAPFASLQQAATTLRNAAVVPLDMGFGFMPVTEKMTAEDDKLAFEGLERLTARLSGWAREQSERFPLAYIETEYFGGVGAQAAIVWKQGRIALGPEISRTDELSLRSGKQPALHERAINRAMRSIDVSRGTEVDEFDALGLGRNRSDDQWLSESYRVA